MYIFALCQVMPIFAELADNPKPLFGGSLQEPLLKPEEEELVPQACNLTRVYRMDKIVMISMSVCFISYCLVFSSSLLCSQR